MSKISDFMKKKIPSKKEKDNEKTKRRKENAPVVVTAVLFAVFF